MRKLLLSIALSAAALAPMTACQSSQVIPPAPGLRRSGEVSFFCLGPDGKGAPLYECPRARPLTTGGQIVGNDGYELHAMVTQTATGEVAVVRMTGKDASGRTTAKVLDVERSIPGPTPLRVGQRPVDIATTPGGYATFVTVAELQKPGIFGLPTSCIFAPIERDDGSFEEMRDLTSWPACSLPSAPGNLVLVEDRPNEAGDVRVRCGGAFEAPANLPTPAAKDRLECPVDLSEEADARGRQKLLVAMPEVGKLVVIDAQELLDRKPGSFDACKIEAELPLTATIPDDLTQPLPKGLVGDDGIATKSYALSSSAAAIPAGMAAVNSLLVVADQGTPLVHRIDVRDVCNPRELPPLVATSYTEPERLVTTSKVAISPVTTKGEQFVYAIDEIGSRSSDLTEAAASIIPFDISPTSPSRLPMLRGGADYTPNEPPDRIVFSSPVKDIAFAKLEEPEVDPTTGVGATGVLCDPDPRTASDAPGALYRSSSDFLSGASPFSFRGIFGYALLGSGVVGLIDVEDLDAACRRPVRVNRSSELDRFGCASDPYQDDYLTEDALETGSAIATDETSCRTVVPHRLRAGTLIRPTTTATSISYIKSSTPGLLNFPRLVRDSRTLPVSRLSAEGKKSPIMLATNYPAPGGKVEPADIVIGASVRPQGAGASLELVIDPGRAQFPSLALPNVEPRAYPPAETVTVAFEGDIGGDVSGLHRTGRLTTVGKKGLLTDTDATFCSAGAMATDQMKEFGAKRFALSESEATRFSERHSDYFQLVTPLLAETDEYWSKAPKECLAIDEDLFSTCDALFGPGNKLDTKDSRDFRITRAFQSHLEFESRSGSEEVMALLACCFPEPVSYRVRAGNHWVVRGSLSGFRHAVKAGAFDASYEDYRCEADNAPLRRREEGRAFEISARSCADGNENSATSCSVGAATAADVVCVVPEGAAPIDPNSSYAACLFEGTTRRFALYRGLDDSVRGMTFQVDVTGGFSSQLANLAGSSTTGATNPTILPVSLSPVPTFSMMAVIDSQSRGLLLMDLRSAAIASNFN